MGRMASTYCYAMQMREEARRVGYGGLAAALAAKGAAETVEGVCRKSIICERIGDARHRPCVEASSVPLDDLAQAQDTLDMRGSMAVLSVWRPLRSQTGSGAGEARSKRANGWWQRLRILGRSQQARDGAGAGLPFVLVQLPDKQLKVRADVGRPHASSSSETAAALRTVL
ncbi:hypothetical protein BU25DRAFT_152362 [Macroventuria anomochaeta]|uniref:Uncharacterized protein n=1 Tax=Macroventuria anomochaeta TaxID=301207 RepID=A0ACB6SDV4_9PLEO|nr:uncharacterized protein BU25DRAFT_152362 [Macroventuria anomochaeta]KAF2632465.1 hypothetical protein BU25DRAFT_152362 [Macroventuria anomochaeta]